MQPNEIKAFYKALLETAGNTGVNIISDDFCCQLLAWVYVFGGGVEATVLDFKMNSDILFAQNKLNIHGGETLLGFLYTEDAWEATTAKYCGGLQLEFVNSDTHE